MTTDVALRAPSSLMPLSGSLDSYIAYVNQIPVVGAEEERDTARRLRDDEDLGAAQALVLANLRHVVYIARSYLGYGLPLADLIQEGNVGLMKAVKRFDPEVGVRLISFAVHWIKAEIHEYIIKNWRIVKVATTKAQRKLFFNLRSMKRSTHALTISEAESIAADLRVKPEEVFEMESRLGGHDLSFSLGTDDEEDAYAPEAWLRDDHDAIADIEADEWQASQQSRMTHALARLDERSRDILQRRWLADGDKAGLQVLADEYGVSAERIRQIESAAMKKLRKAIEAPAG